MMKKLYLFTCIVFILLLYLEPLAMAKFSDTLIKVDEVTVRATKRKFAPGVKIEKIDSKKIEKVNSQDLGKTLAKFTPLYIKSYSSGFSTLSFRGMSPNHVGIYCDDINFNSLTLGHSNLSLIPMFFFDDMEVQYGGASALYGSDAMAGTIHLNSNPEFNKGYSSMLQTDLASFENAFAGGRFRISDGKFESATKGYYKQGENDFPFLNVQVKDFIKGEYVQDHQKNNALESYGLFQEFFFRPEQQHTMYAKLFYHNSWREIQPKMSTNYYGGSFEQIKNENYYLLAGYSYKGTVNQLKIQSSYISNLQVYDNINTIATQRFNVGINDELTLPFNGKINGGVKLTHVVPEVHAYREGLTEFRTDLFASYSQTIKNNTNVVVNLRESLISNFNPAFSPAVGVSQLIPLSTIQYLKVQGHYSHNYKIPTFNDRFWGDAGNPDLKPEYSENLEGTIQWKISNQAFTMAHKITGFYNKVKNMILWFPLTADRWVPENRQLIHARGIETGTSVKFKTYSWKWSIMANYHYNLSTVKKVYDQKGDAHEIGQQLAYTPKNNVAASVFANHKKWNAGIDGHFTGDRLNSNLDNQLEGFFLLNASIGRKIKVFDSSLHLNMSVNNILDKSYINMENYAMPGINWRFSVKYLFNNQNKN
jgi:iron complex outermembrane receptor protein